MSNTISELNFSDHSVEDMYRLAVHIEQGGYDFYSRISESSENPRVKNEVIFLRDEEAKHKNFFQKQLKSRGQSAAGKLGGELGNWLDQEFVKPMEEVWQGKNVTKNEEALQLGVRLEQTTIDLYTKLLAQSSEESVQKDLQAIIDEEYKHKQKLNLLLAF
jgi:rubrerythrin